MKIDEYTGNLNENMKIIELCCNVDDMKGEDIAYAAEKLKQEGASDVSWQPVGMKKGRPGILLVVLCKLDDREKMLHLIFRHTSTIGIRETVCRKHLLRSSIGFVETPYGEVRIKTSTGYGVERVKAEYEDLRRIAEEQDLSMDEVRKLVSIENRKEETA